LILTLKALPRPSVAEKEPKTGAHANRNCAQSAAPHISGTAEQALRRTPSAAVGRSGAFRVKARLAARRTPSEISTVARPGDRREGEYLAVMKQSDTTAITAS
jgi:hypothetical protein